MAVIKNLDINISANTAKLSKGLNKASSDLDIFKSKISSATKIIGGLAIGGTIVAGLKASVKAFAEQEDAVAQFEARLKSTKSAAGITSKEMQALAGSLQNTTTFADEATVSAGALLATFTNIKGDNFKSAIKGIQDMTIAMGNDDMQTATIQVGKALNDPIQGITALSKVGVSFTEKQKAVIKSLVETGQVAKAQKVILDELATEFGGSATAAAETLNGKLKQTKNAIGEIAESIGGLLAPSIKKWADSLKNVANGANGAETNVQAQAKEALATTGDGYDPKISKTRVDLKKIKEARAALNADTYAANNKLIENGRGSFKGAFTGDNARVYFENEALRKKIKANEELGWYIDNKALHMQTQVNRRSLAGATSSLPEMAGSTISDLTGKLFRNVAKKDKDGIPILDKDKNPVINLAFNSAITDKIKNRVGEVGSGLWAGAQRLNKGLVQPWIADNNALDVKRKEGKALLDAMKNPSEQYADKIKHFTELLNSGALKPEQFKKLQQHEEQQLRKDLMTGNKLGDVGWARKGSAEALAIEARHANGMGAENGVEAQMKKANELAMEEVKGINNLKVAFNDGFKNIKIAKF